MHYSYILKQILKINFVLLSLAIFKQKEFEFVNQTKNLRNKTQQNYSFKISYFYLKYLQEAFLIHVE